MSVPLVSLPPRSLEGAGQPQRPRRLRPPAPRGWPRGARLSSRGRSRIPRPPRGCPHPTPGHAGPGLGPQTAGGISGEGKGGGEEKMGNAP